MEYNRSNIQASILNRLIDNEPNITHEPVPYRLLSIKQIKALLIRDLENLLNTRQQILLPPISFTELNNSLFVYGLRDYTAENSNSSFVKQRLRHDIEKAIILFEPRLKNVTVRFETSSQVDRKLRFRISGLLAMESETESVVFDTIFDANKRKYIIAK